MFVVNQIGYNFQESSGSVIDRPKGSGDYLLLYFLTEVEVLFQGRMQLLPPLSLVLFSPQCPQHYRHSQQGFVNDWIHFSLTSSDDDTWLSHLKLPLNQPFSGIKNHTLRRAFQDLEKEFRLKEPYYTDEIHARLQSLLIMLARRQRQSDKQKLSAHLQNHYDQLRQVRSQILTQYQRSWSLESMARMARLSRSRFCSLYQEFFQTSPMQDLAHERFTLARHLLLTTGSSVCDIADRVGYSDPCHFSKQYKKFHGICPEKTRLETSSS